METGHFDSKLFWYELKRWNFAKSLFTSKKVCIWTRKTFWVNIFHSISFTGTYILKKFQLFDNWINCNCCCCWYTSKERNYIETTCFNIKGLCIKRASNHRGMLTQGWYWGKDKQAFLIVKLTFSLNCVINLF